MKEGSAEMMNAKGRAYGDIIREYRKRKGLNQEQLGAIAHVKKNAVGAWEAGRSRPDVASIPALCEALGLPLSVFFGMDEPVDASEAADFSTRFRRLDPHHREIVMRQMDMLYDLQDAETEKP